MARWCVFTGPGMRVSAQCKQTCLLYYLHHNMTGVHPVESLRVPEVLDVQMVAAHVASAWWRTTNARCPHLPSVRTTPERLHS